MRPANEAGPLLTMLSAADGGRSVIGADAGVLAAGRSTSPRPSATAPANASSTLRRLATMRARMAGFSTFDSSNTNALTMCCCSTAVWLMRNCRAWL